MTTQQMQQQIDTRTHGTGQGTVKLRDVRGDVEIEVRVIQPRWIFGRFEILVEPIAGAGQWWMEFDGLHPAATTAA